MKIRGLVRLGQVCARVIFSASLCAPVFCQSEHARTDAKEKAWPKFLEDGQPDVQGVWSTVYYGMGCLTNPTNGDVGCVPPPGPRPAPGTANAGGPPPPGDGPSSEAKSASAADAATRATNGSQQAPRARRVRHNAPSRITDTPDRKVPYNAVALAHQQDLFAHYYQPSRPGDIDPQQMCWPLGPVRQLTWHDVQIEQFPGYVLFIFEGAEQYRIVYLDDRPHVGPRAKLFMGDSRGRWEGTTLVVDTTNNNAKGRFSRAGDFASDQVHYIERFHFNDVDHFRYEARVEDASVYTRPWTFAFDEQRTYFGGDGGGPPGPVTPETQAQYENWEEACHEGLRPGENALYGAAGTKVDSGATNQ